MAPDDTRREDEEKDREKPASGDAPGKVKPPEGEPPDPTRERPGHPTRDADEK